MIWNGGLKNAYIKVEIQFFPTHWWMLEWKVKRRKEREISYSRLRERLVVLEEAARLSSSSTVGRSVGGGGVMPWSPPTGGATRQARPNHSRR